MLVGLVSSGDVASALRCIAVRCGALRCVASCWAARWEGYLEVLVRVPGKAGGLA